MADTILVTKSNIAVLEANTAEADTALRVSRVRLVIISGTTDISVDPPAGRRNIVVS